MNSTYKSSCGGLRRCPCSHIVGGGLNGLLLLLLVLTFLMLLLLLVLLEVRVHPSKLLA